LHCQITAFQPDKSACSFAPAAQFLVWPADGLKIRLQKCRSGEFLPAKLAILLPLAAKRGIMVPIVSQG